MAILVDSSKFEKKFNDALEACRAPCDSGLCEKCPFFGLCEGQDKEELKDKFLKGLIVWSKGELVEKDEIDEVFEICFNEETNSFDVFPDIYDGDEMTQSTIFRDIKDVFLDNEGRETTNTNDNSMVKIPKLFWEMNKEGRNISIVISRKEIGRALAHTVPETLEVKEQVYIGKHLMTEGFKSEANKMPISNISFNACQKGIREAYQNTGYRMIGFYQLTLLQILYILRFKTLDSKTALGRGVTDTSSKVKNEPTKSLFWGDDTGKKHVVMCGIENFYGNLYYSIDGLQTDDKDIIVWKGTKLESRTKAYFGSGTLEKVVGSTEFGFAPIFD